MLFLSRNEIEQLLDPHELITALEEGFKAISTSQLNAPPRNQAIAPKGVLVAMPANMPNRRMSVKLVTVFHENIPAHQAAFILFDSETSTPIAFMDGEYITVMRTAAGAILSIKTLARKDSKSLTIIGAGVLGHTHIKMIGTLVGIEQIWIASRSLTHAQALAAHGSYAHAVDSIQQAVSRADMVCLCTSSLEPVIHKGWLKERVHVTSVGYRPPEREFQHDLVEASHVFVE